MSLISSSIPNLINGVSQQPPSLRLPTQCEAMENLYPSIVEGLTKRPPTVHIAKLINGNAGACKVHMYNRDANEKYAVVLRNENIKVFDLEDGSEKPVSSPDGLTYLASADPQEDFSVITVADYTFIVNKTKVPTMDTSVVAQNTRRGMVFVKQGTYGGKYEVYVDGVVKASHTTSTTAVDQITTEYIADQLATQLTTNLGAGWTVWRVNHVISIRKDDGTSFTLRTVDPLGGEALKSNTGTVQSLTDLPTTCVHGQVVKVAGDNNSQFDDYWVKFTANDGSFSEGYWSETVGIGSKYMINSANMPHVLISNGDGTFTFEQATWANRTTGDETSAPAPSFIGNTITDIVFFRNRLGLISGQNVVLSKAGEYFRFFPDTVVDVLDDAPIDISASHTKVSLLRHAIPFNKSLLLFSEQTQFVLEADELLSPKTASITTATEFETDPSAKPVGAGQNIYFATKRGRYSGLREYFVDTDAETMDAADVTAHVPQYLPADIAFMDISSSEDALLAGSADADEDHRLYLYKYYWQGNEKLQSAWGRWSFNANAIIRGLKFINSEVYLVIQHGTDGLYLEKMNIESGRLDTGASYVTHLDRRCTDEDCSVTYSAGNDETTFNLPYQRTDSMIVVSRTDGVNVPGRVAQIVSTSTSSIKVKGDWTSIPVYIGEQYEARYVFSEPVLKEQSKGGGQVAVQAGRLQIRRYLITYSDTGYFTVEVTPRYRDTFVYPFTGRILGSGSNIIGQVAVEDGTFKVPVLANSREFTIEVKSDSFLPMKLQNAEWEAFYTIRSQRL